MDKPKCSNCLDTGTGLDGQPCPICDVDKPTRKVRSNGPVLPIIIGVMIYLVSFAIYGYLETTDIHYTTVIALGILYGLGTWLITLLSDPP